MDLTSRSATTMLHALTPEQLEVLIQKAVSGVLNGVNLNSESTTPSTNKELYTREETAQYFSISLNCLHDWVRKGIIKPYKVSGRTYFKFSEFESILKNG